MRVTQVGEAFPSLAYRCAGPGGIIRERYLDRHEVLVDALPLGLQAIVVTGDLQGREAAPPHRLLGEAVADALRGECAPSGLGVLLAGDLYANEGVDKLGSSGDVGEVWRAFSNDYRWTTGVLGNHDRLKEAISGTTLLDGQIIEMDGLRIGGVGGIVGKASRLLRRDLKSYLETLGQVLSGQPDVVVLHESPAGDFLDLRGNPHIAELLRQSAPTLVVCGHCRWPHPLTELANGTQILNVDSRLCILRVAEPAA